MWIELDTVIKTVVGVNGEAREGVLNGGKTGTSFHRADETVDSQKKLLCDVHRPACAETASYI